MRREQVTSTNLSEIGFEEDDTGQSATLEVRFQSGIVYQYTATGRLVVNRLRAAHAELLRRNREGESVGQYFNREVRDAFAYQVIAYPTCLHNTPADQLCDVCHPPEPEPHIGLQHLPGSEGTIGTLGRGTPIEWTDHPAVERDATTQAAFVESRLAACGCGEDHVPAPTPAAAAAVGQIDPTNALLAIDAAILAARAQLNQLEVARRLILAAQGGQSHADPT